jgi:capsular exopolysaccharide synthesis family protein
MPLASLSNGSHRSTEAYRQLRTNLQFVSGRRSSLALQVTSAEGSEGKSVTCSHLAVVAAQTGQRVLVVSADLRSPGVDALLEVDPSAEGLSAWLAGLTGAPPVIGTSVDKLDVLPSGDIPPNPGQLLTSERIGRLLEEVKGRYDLVLVDTPPVLPLADALVIAPCTDAVLLVADTKHSRLRRLARAVQELEMVDAKIVGTVLNRYDVDRQRPYTSTARASGRRSHVADTRFAQRTRRRRTGSE